MTPPLIICFHPLTSLSFFWVLILPSSTPSCYPFLIKATTLLLFISTMSLINYTYPSISTWHPFVVVFSTCFSFVPYLLLSFSRFLRPSIRAPPLLCGTFHDRIHKDQQHWNQSWCKLRWCPLLSYYQFLHRAMENSYLASERP